MAKPRRKARRSNLRRVRVNAVLSVGALAALDVTSGAMTDAVADKLRFISLIGSWGWSDIGAVIDDGMSFGVAHGDYSAQEIEECLEATTGIDLGDKLALEKTNRLVREIGMFTNTTSVAAVGGSSFNDGAPVKTRLNWLMSEGDTLQIWVRNASATVYTTGSEIIFSGNLWVKD